MEMLKSKPIIALIIMILGVSYFSALDTFNNSGVQNQKSSESINAQA